MTPARQSIDQLLHAKWVITCEENNRVLTDHSVAIHESKILAILPKEEAKSRYQAETTRDLPHHALLPGFINAHTHAAMNLLRGLADDLNLMDWLENHIWPAEGKWVSPEFVFEGTSLAIAEMIRSGTTCFNDMYFFLNDTAKAAEIAGIRAHIGMTVIGVPTAWAKTTDEYFQKGLEFLNQYRHHDLITPTVAPHSTYTVSIEELARVKQLAEDHQLHINIHLQEDPEELARSVKTHGKRPLERLAEIGFLSDRVIAIHMTQLSESDFDLLRQYKPSIVHCPESNLKLVSGICPVERLHREGVNVALGTDGACSNNDLDMITEMRSAAFLGKLGAQDAKAVSAEHVLKMATLHGAKALGIDHLTGSLTAGKAADCIAINLECIETQPLYHPVSQVVYAASRNQVSDVWVAGKPLLTNRELMTLDESALIAKAKAWRDRIKTL